MYSALTPALLKSFDKAIQKGLDQITEAYTENDIEHLTKGLNTILSSFGKSLEQSTFQEIDELMRDKSRVLEL